MYKVTSAFKDSQDNLKEYNVGDTFQSQDEQRVASLIEQKYIVVDSVKEQPQNEAARTHSEFQGSTKSNQDNNKNFTQLKQAQAKARKAKEAGE